MRIYYESITTFKSDPRDKTFIHSELTLTFAEPGAITDPCGLCSGTRKLYIPG